MAKRKRRRPGETLLYGFIALFSLLVMVPFLFTVIHSLMPPEQVRDAYGSLGSEAIRLQLWPKPLGIRQYIRVFFGTELEWYYSFHNTLLLSVPILLMTILLCTMSGYGLSKFRFPGRKALLISYIIILLLPVQVTLVQFFIFFNTMHLMESRFPLIAFCSFSPFGAF